MIIKYLIEKEFKQMLRNILLPIIFVILPLGLMNMVPRIATQEVKGLKFVVVDNDRTTASRRLINKINASTYLSLTDYVASYDEAMKSINSGEADVIVEIPHHLERDMMTTGKTDVAVFANATNGTKGGMSSMYITQIVNSYAQELAHADSPADALSLRYLFNTRLDYKIYMIPAIFALLLTLIVGFLPALNIVGEKEKGTIEQINVTPIGKMDFIISKIVPYVVVGLLMTLEALMAAKILYGIVPAGSVAILLCLACLFCMLVSSLGLIVSNFTSTIQQAALTMFFFLVIFILMSGLLTPINSMPQWAQCITLVNPMRYFIEAMRFIYIKGSDFSQLMSQFCALGIYTVVGWTIAILSYKKNA